MRNWVDVPVSGKYFKEWMTTGKITFVRCGGGLPEGAAFVRSWYDVHTDIVHLVFEHPSFQEVEEECYTPSLDPWFEDLLGKTLSELICPNDD